MSQQGRGYKNDIIGTLTIKTSVGQCYLQVTSNLKMFAEMETVKTTIL